MNTERKLATVRIISELRDIPGANNIQLAIIDGWQCVVKKGEFKKNDKCVYFEIDSFLPIESQYEFLRKSSYKKNELIGEGFKIGTLRLKKQLSQGLALPLEDNSLAIGTDLTSKLNIKLYKDPAYHISGNIKGKFPSFIPKTNQERIQNIWNDVKYLNSIFEVSTKLDGTSMTLYKYNGEFGICGRNFELYIDHGNLFGNSLVRTGIKYKDAVPEGFAVQGELVGPGIQKNRYDLKSLEFLIFDIYDINKQQYLSSRDRLDYIPQFVHVPIIGYRTMNDFPSIEDILNFAGTYKSLNNKITEGVVFKNLDNPNLSFKVINNEYLLKVVEKD